MPCFSWQNRRDRLLRYGYEIKQVSAHQARTMDYLMAHRGRVVSRVELADYVWYDDDDPPLYAELEIRLFIHRLRHKFGTDSIRTERGRGFYLPASPCRASDRFKNSEGVWTAVKVLMEPSVLLHNAEKDHYEHRRLDDPFVTRMQRLDD